MLKKLSRFFHQKSNGWLLLISTAIFMIFMVYILPQQAEKSKAYAAEAGSVDMRFFLSSEEIFDMAEQYGESGRAQYIRARLTFDTLYPLAYGFFLILATSFFLNKAFTTEQFAHTLNLVPFFGVIFDFLENISASLVMAAYPEKRVFFAFLVTLFTPTKWILVSTSFLVILIGLLGWAVNRKKERHDK